MIKARRKAYNAFKPSCTRAQEKWRFYVNIRNEVSKAVQREKKSFAKYKLDKCSDAKQMWNGLKSLGLKQRTLKTIPSHLQNPDLIDDFFINSLKMNEHHLQKEIEFYEKHKLQDQNHFNFEVSVKVKCKVFYKKFTLHICFYGVYRQNFGFSEHINKF
jgi:hypothetical protein